MFYGISVHESKTIKQVGCLHSAYLVNL